MGFCLYGNDINDTTSPIEAGLGWITKFNHDFVNAEYLAKQKADKPNRRLTGFVMTEKGIPVFNAPGANANAVTTLETGTIR